MPEPDRIEIKEAYKGYVPPVNTRGIVRALLATVPEKYFRGLDCIVLTNFSSQPRHRRLGKTKRRGRRIARSHTAGLYHPKWKGQPPWIELYVDQIFRGYPRWALWSPFVKNLAIANTLYHELGHHIQYFIRPEYREKEDVADDWKKKLMRNLFRKKYSYLIPVAKIIKLFWRK